MVRELLRSRKVTQAVLKFLFTTRAGERSRVVYLEQEKRRRRRGKTWGLEEDRLEDDDDKKEEGNRETECEGSKEGEEAKGG